MHHYLLGWFCASFGQFNHRASAAMLAIGAGVLAQGAGAYGMDTFFAVKGGCFEANIYSPALVQFMNSLGCPIDDSVVPSWEQARMHNGTGLARIHYCPRDADTQRAMRTARCFPGF